MQVSAASRMRDARGLRSSAEKIHHLRHWTSVRLIVNVSRVTVLLAIASTGPPAAVIPARTRGL